ncbi:MAG: efflux RND transporter periplasmic adaptor subunit [Phycisphaerales bacterium]
MPSRAGAVMSLIVRTVVGLGAIAVAVAVFGWLASTREVPVPRPPEEARPRLVVVSATPVEVQRSFSGFGTADAIRTADVPAEVTGVIESIPVGVSEGFVVSAGEVLATVNARDFRRQAEIAEETLAELDARAAQLDVEEQAAKSRLELAKRDVELARLEFSRTERALADGAAVEREVDRAKQALLAVDRAVLQAQESVDGFMPRRASLRAVTESQRAAKRLAEQNLARCTIRSPIDGVIEDVDVEIGESVSPGRRVARIVDLGSIEIPLKLPSSARRFVRVGDAVTIERDADDAQCWQARIARVAPVDEPGSRTFTVYAELEQSADDPLALVPGTFVLGTVRCGDPETRVVVPRRSVRDGRVLLAEAAGEAHSIATHPVEIEWTFEAALPQFPIPDTQWVVLSEELPAGTLVLLDGSRAVSPGTLVRPVLPGGAPAAIAGAAKAPEGAMP